MSYGHEYKPWFIARMLVMIGLCSIFAYLPMVSLEAEELVEQTPSDEQTAPPLCDATPLENASTPSVNFSSSEEVISIICNLEEARHAIAADAADLALEQIDEAERSLVAILGNNTGT